MGQPNRVREHNPHWKGGSFFDGKYMNLRLPTHPRAGSDGYVRRSIVNWEKANGLPFPEGKEPHHRNENKMDDRPENIEPLTHEEHTSLHRRLAIEVAEVRRLYANGLTVRTIADKLGVSIGTVHGRLHDTSNR